MGSSGAGMRARVMAARGRRRERSGPAGLVGNAQPENKTKRQRLACALGSSLVTGETCVL